MITDKIAYVEWELREEQDTGTQEDKIQGTLGSCGSQQRRAALTLPGDREQEKGGIDTPILLRQGVETRPLDLLSVICYQLC